MGFQGYCAAPLGSKRTKGGGGMYAQSVVNSRLPSRFPKKGVPFVAPNVRNPIVVLGPD